MYKNIITCFASNVMPPKRDIVSRQRATEWMSAFTPQHSLAHTFDPSVYICYYILVSCAAFSLLVDGSCVQHLIAIFHTPMCFDCIQIFPVRFLCVFFFLHGSLSLSLSLNGKLLPFKVSHVLYTFTYTNRTTTINVLLVFCNVWQIPTLAHRFLHSFTPNISLN